MRKKEANDFLLMMGRFCPCKFWLILLRLMLFVLTKLCYQHGEKPNILVDALCLMPLY